MLKVRAPENIERGRNIVLTILRATGVVALIEGDKAGGIRRYYYPNSVVQPTKTLKALAVTVTIRFNPINISNRHFKKRTKVIRTRLEVLYILHDFFKENVSSTSMSN